MITEEQYKVYRRLPAGELMGLDIRVADLDDKSPRTLLVGREMSGVEESSGWATVHVYLGKDALFHVTRRDELSGELLDHDQGIYINPTEAIPGFRTFPEASDMEFLKRLREEGFVPVMASYQAFSPTSELHAPTVNHDVPNNELHILSRTFINRVEQAMDATKGPRHHNSEVPTPEMADMFRKTLEALVELGVDGQPRKATLAAAVREIREMADDWLDADAAKPLQVALKGAYRRHFRRSPSPDSLSL